MIIDRYPPRRLFRLVPDLPQAFEPEKLNELYWLRAVTFAPAVTSASTR